MASKKNLLLSLALTAALLGGCAQNGAPDASSGGAASSLPPPSEAQSPSSPKSGAPKDTVGIAEPEMTGDALSPDGRFEARISGVNQSITAAGLYPAESIQLVDTATGEFRWEGLGYYTQDARWSPDGRYVALSCGARTYSEVFVVDTADFQSVAVPLPDGESGGDYCFLVADQWTDDTTLALVYEVANPESEGFIQQKVIFSLDPEATVDQGVSRFEDKA